MRSKIKHFIVIAPVISYRERKFNSLITFLSIFSPLTFAEILPLHRVSSVNNASDSTEGSVLSHQRELNSNFDKAIVKCFIYGKHSVTHLSR